jgi:putative transposase
MPSGLKRYYGTGSLHFITWSCYRRKPLLGNPARRDLLLAVLELMRVRYRFAVIGYVVMPEHVHLLISEPLIGDPSKIIQAVKLSVSRRLAIKGEFSGKFWQSSFYDFNLWSQQKEVEKLKYMHRNPVRRGLVASPEIGGGVATDPMHPERRDWFGSTTGPGGRREFGVALADGLAGCRRKTPLLAKNARNGAPGRNPPAISSDESFSYPSCRIRSCRNWRSGSCWVRASAFS